MAPSAIADHSPPSAIQEELESAVFGSESSHHPEYLTHLAISVLHNLQYQHDWTALNIHTHSSITQKLLPRPIVSGLPPKRAYIHPDEQIAILKVEHETGKSITQSPEPEWVLPAHWTEKWSLAKFAEAFDALAVVPPISKRVEGEDNEDDDELKSVGEQWRGENRQKRLLLATTHDDSTVIYYIMHDGIVKPRQN